MPSERVLISGAGISGSILAYWLGKYGFQVTVVERSKSEQKQGQGLEIEEPALQVVKAMGVMDRLQEKKTGELGFNLVDEQGRSHAQFDIGGFSPTGALEMMRGDMTEIFYKAADVHPNVTYRFETTIRNLTQTQDKVTVDLENRNTKTTTTEEFDLVVGADGQRSRTRQLIMGTPEEINCFKPGRRLRRLLLHSQRSLRLAQLEALQLPRPTHHMDTTDWPRLQNHIRLLHLLQHRPAQPPRRKHRR